MKTALRVGLAAFGLAVLNLSAPISASLDIQTDAELTITGAVSTVYSVEYVTDEAQTNTPSAWRCLDKILNPSRANLQALHPSEARLDTGDSSWLPIVICARVVGGTRNRVSNSWWLRGLHCRPESQSKQGESQSPPGRGRRTEIFGLDSKGQAIVARGVVV
ncbi:MAG: hypothetical protein AB9869_23735 [Verrucomicrobiia bacterium]